MTMFTHDIVEPNGKTIRENNLALPHTIPLGALVQINYEGSEMHNMRLFVVKHTRDCDGTPLYGLHHKRDIMEQIADFKDLFHEAYTSGMEVTISNGWDADILEVVNE